MKANYEFFKSIFKHILLFLKKFGFLATNPINERMNTQQCFILVFTGIETHHITIE